MTPETFKRLCNHGTYPPGRGHHEMAVELIGKCTIAIEMRLINEKSNEVGTLPVLLPRINAPGKNAAIMRCYSWQRRRAYRYYYRGAA